MTDQDTSKIGPIIDTVDPATLYNEESYEAVTPDGWTLVITRLRPIPQQWHQPLLNQPLVCVHGFSQNRLAWTAGDFARNMLYFGADLHLVELRGHGRSSRMLQEERALESNAGLPADFDYDWTLDSYFLQDIPTAIDAVKKATGKRKVYYCGHSMGGMLGYGLASSRKDIAGMVTIGSPSELGRESMPLRAAARLAMLLPIIQAALKGFNVTRRAHYRGIHHLARSLRSVPGLGNVANQILAVDLPRDLQAKVVRMDVFLRLIYWFVQATDQEGYWIPRPFRLFNPTKQNDRDLAWLLTEGAEIEPIGVLENFVSWINHREMKCYTTNYSFAQNFKNITIPMTIIFGDQDFLAGVKSTRKIYNDVASDYIVWRPVRGNSHLEITMGNDVRQICYDIKNMMEYAMAHQDRSPRLPRFKSVKKAV